MINTAQVQLVFHEGDEVALAKGSYEGTPGVFLKLREDPNWADIEERNGSIRSHPVVCLAHSNVATVRPAS